MSIEWNISNRLRADALHKSVLDWGTLTAAADEIERLRAALEIIAGSSDKLQALQARAALDNIGAKV